MTIHRDEGHDDPEADEVDEDGEEDDENGRFPHTGTRLRPSGREEFVICIAQSISRGASVKRASVWRVQEGLEQPAQRALILVGQALGNGVFGSAGLRKFVLKKAGFRISPEFNPY